MRDHACRGYSFIDVLLVSAVVAALAAGMAMIAIWHQHSAAINETVRLVDAMRLHGELARGLYAEDSSGYDNGYVAGRITNVGAMPQEWLDGGVQIRNPLGEGEFWGYSTTNGSDGSAQYAFWFFDIPRWSCAELAIGLAEFGFIQANGAWLNRAADGGRIPIDTSKLQTRCNVSLTSSVPTLILVGPAPN